MFYQPDPRLAPINELEPVSWLPLGQVLLHGRRRPRMLLDIRSDDDRLYLFERLDAVPLAPGEKLSGRLRVGRPRVRVPYGGRKEFDELPCGGFARASDDCRQVLKSGAAELPPGDRDEIPAHVSGGCPFRRR